MEKKDRRMEEDREGLRKTEKDGGRQKKGWRKTEGLRRAEVDGGEGWRRRGRCCHCHFAAGCSVVHQ